MTEEKDQTPEKTRDVDTTEKKNTSAAVKTSEKFDELIDSQAVEETPAGDEEEVPVTKAEEEDTGEEKTGQIEGEVKVSPEIIKKAVDLGLTEEEAGSFGSDEELSRTISILEAIASEDEGRQDTQPAASGEKQPEKPAMPESFKFEFKNEEDIDPELLANIKKLQSHYEGTIQKLSEKVNGLVGDIVRQEQERFIKRFDGMIDALGPEFMDTFGKGETLSLSRRTAAYKNRDSIRARMYAYAYGLKGSGQSVPDEQHLFDIALYSLFGNKLKTVESLRLGRKTQERSKQRIGRAATRQTGTMTPLEKAYETSRRFDDLVDTAET